MEKQQKGKNLIRKLNIFQRCHSKNINDKFVKRMNGGT